MKKLILLTIAAVFACFPLTSVFAASSVASITPTANQLDNFDGPEGAELFVFMANSVGTTYTIVFNVDEEPASLVGLPGKINSYAYDSGAGTITIEFDHTGYAEGTQPPGPPTSFSIALVAAVGDEEDGPPAAMKGSYMGTNLGPSDWMLLPPSEDSPAFGFQLSGGKGTTAYFQMFIPAGMIAFLSDIFDEELTYADLAAFNNGTETTVSVEELGTGALVEVDVLFSVLTTLEPADDDDEEGDLAFTGVSTRAAKSLNKKITVNKAANLGLSSNRKKVKSGKKVKLLGCVNENKVAVIAGEKVIISSSLKKSNGKKRKLRAVLDNNYCYSKSIKLTEAASFKALLKPNTEIGRGAKVNSKRIKVKVKK